MNVEQSSPSSAPTRPSLVLAGFVLLVFCTGTAEYLVAGVLPQLAADLSVSVAAAGQTVTAYALGVAIGGPIVTVLTARLPRKGLALGLGAVFVVGIVLTVLAPTYGWVIVGRVVSASSQATLFAIGLTTAAGLMGPGRQGQAIAIVSSGLTVATVLGVPLGALLGGTTSWRIPFVVVAAAAAVGVLLIAAAMPRTAAPTTGVGDEIRTLLRGPVLLAVATTVIGFAGVSVVFTYLVPLMSEVTGIVAGVIPALLLAYGVGGFAGNLIAGRLTDLSLGKTLVGVFVALIVTLAAFPLVAEHPVLMVAAVLVLGLLSTATIAPLQSLVLRHAGAAPTLSLAVNVGAFNLANAIGSALGGIGVAAGLLQWGGLGGAGFAVLGLILTALALRAAPRPDATSSATTMTKEHSL
ncbi:MFS transporter [Kocuria rhizophila]|uniref:MFS transporter n=1 Tax=Kocuria rhizophila TaxID=72000 RepID=UPI002ED1F498|nr:MFS transporter [Kocuria rhizophila]